MPCYHTVLRAASTAAALGCALPAFAQETAESYPSRNIALIVQFAPGGPTDFVARTVGQAMSDILGKPVVIENRPGGGTSIGTAMVVKAPPDGYTLASVDVSLTIMPLIIANLSYDPLKDLKPISQTAVTSLTLTAANNLAAKSASELVALARSKPGEITMAHSGIGSPPHLAALSLIQSTDTKMVLVSYRGAGPAVQDIVAGHVSLLMTAPSTSVELAKAGKVRLLGVTGSQRLTALPEVPTLKEQGVEVPELDAGQWFGIAAPAATRPDIIAKLNGVINKATQDAGVREKLAKLDVFAKGSTPEELTGLIEKQATAWANTLRKAGVKPE